MTTPLLRAEVHSLPSEDDEFRSAVAKAMETYELLAPDALVEILRPAYPGVEVIDRDPLGSFAVGTVPVWYAFRDGETVPDDAEQ